MSTNYYIKGYKKEGIDRDSPDWHIGKRIGAGKGKTNFTWAIHPTMLRRRLRQESFSETNVGKGIVAENGPEFTFDEFLKKIVEKAEVVFDNAIGLHFC